MTDKAHKVIKYIVDNNPKEYDAIKEKLLDHFHEDEKVEKYVKKFNKAHRKPGEKISDFAIRLQDIFKHAYPDSHAEASVSTRFGTFFGTFDFGVFGTHIKRLVPPFI